MAAPRVILAIFNDPNYDQRMIRIAGSLQSAGYDVLLVGAAYKAALPLTAKPYRQFRFSMLFGKGKVRYIEFNLRLFFFLLWHKAELVCAVDLDSIVPVYWATRLKKTQRVYDAHEWFSEMKEVVSRPAIHRVWKWVERNYVPRFPNGYTVNEQIAEQFRALYGVAYPAIRNMPLRLTTDPDPVKKGFLLYQGAVNEGRAFEWLIPAMKWVEKPLYIYGTGNFYEQAASLIREQGLDHKVFLQGKLLPHELQKITPGAQLGFTLFETSGKSNYFSLANRFFDYVQAGVPQVCVDFPVYRNLNKAHPVAVLVTLTDPESLAKVINDTVNNQDKYRQLVSNCMLKRNEWNWENESEKLLRFYHKLSPI